jgi:alpha-mannosidase
LLDESACDTWAHDEVSLGAEVGVFENAKFEIIENGPVIAILRSIATCENSKSTVTRDFCLLADDDRIFVKTKVDFHEKHKALKFTFPAENETVTSKIPYGTVTRKGCTGEEPCGSFTVSGALAVANDSKYSYDVENGEMRLTVLRGAAYADHHGHRDNKMDYIDQGISEFSYCIFEHRNLSNTERYASELNFAPRHIMGSFHRGFLPEEFSGFGSDADNLIFPCIKQAENGNDIVLRCFELEGKETDAKISLFGNEISVACTPYALKTVSGDGKEMNILEDTISLTHEEKK